MTLKLIQRQVPIGSKVTFIQKNGHEISGVLVEIGKEHITIEDGDKSTTILIEMIGGWNVITIPEAEDPVEEIQPIPTHNIPLIKDQGLSHPENKDILTKLVENNTRLDAQIQGATITFTQPSFVLPSGEFNGKKSTELVRLWERAKSKYEYALKVNELSSKFGRIQNVLSDLRTLYDLVPDSANVRRHLIYILWLMGNRAEAVKLYKETVVVMKESADWLNLAAYAILEKQEILALYSLEQYFLTCSISQSPDAWFLFLKLIIQFSDYFILGSFQQKVTSESEAKILLDAQIFLLEKSDKQNLALDLMQKYMEGVSVAKLTVDAMIYFNGPPNDAYKEVVSDMIKKPQPRPISRLVPNKSQGAIYSYKPDRGYGFIRDNDGGNYFFHRSAITDDKLLEKVYMFSYNEQIPVVFDVAEGPKGAFAIGVALTRTIDEIYSLATEYADDGEYPKAIALIKRVLDIDSNYPNAQVMYEKWREYARSTGVPRGSNPYARAKRLQLIEKDLGGAVQLFRVAINKGDNLDSAVKDLAMLFVQQSKTQDAIDVLLKNRSNMFDQKSVDNMLLSFYQSIGQHDLAIALLQKKMSIAPTEGKKAQLLWQIANSYFRQENYSEAERNFRILIMMQPDNNAAQRNLAVCLFKQCRYDDAESMLNQILSIFPDPQVVDLLNAIVQARSGQQPLIDDIIIETTLSNFSREISGFTQFFLTRCDFQGVPADHVQKQIFNHADILKLEDLASQLGTRRPRDRAGYYLSASKIVSLLDDEDPNLFYKYLCRSFASRGDAVVIESRPLDAAREFYCEALNAYDGDRSSAGLEQDANNALVRFLFATLGQSQIPTDPRRYSIDGTLETILTRHPDQNKVFDAIAYLVLRSRFAANRILKSLYDKSSLQAMAIEYLKSKSIIISLQVKRLVDFVGLWNDLQRKNIEDARIISNELRFISKTGITTASLESSIERIKGLFGKFFFDLDHQRISQLQKILETALDLCKQVTFEEQERLCDQLDSRCQDLLREIEGAPTKISVEEIYPAIESMLRKVNAKREELYESSTPQLTLRLPVESYIPDNNQQIEIQITVNNRVGCSPAEALEIVVQEYADTYSVEIPEIKLESSLRGGDQRILIIPIRVGREAIHSQTFSLPIYVQYRTRSAEIIQTPVNNFSIRLYSENEFEPINNPYAAYAEGGVVGDVNMFFGREEMIINVAKTIKESKQQSKCVVIYGQKRAGKSSILYHLKSKLGIDDNLLILDIGNIGKFLDDNNSSSYPFLHLILWSIIRRLEYAIEDRVEAGKPPIGMTFPGNDKEFFEHPSPLTYFTDLFDRFKRQANKQNNWQGIRAVLLIDEFQYIYAQILAGRIPESFMRNWKALLQENYFSAVLVGQDVMPKFKQQFPNEFGTTQDERVTYLKRDDTIRLIDEPIRIGGGQGESRYRERAIERIIDLTSGSPFYVQILCNRLVEYMNRKHARLVTEADVEQVKDELMKGTNALGPDKFDNLLNSGDTSKDLISDNDALCVLTAIALNSQTGPCSRNNLTCETITSIDNILEDLVKRDVIDRERGQYYSIRVGLFKEWLITHQ